MTEPDRVLELIERFDRNRESYMSGAYNETQLRNEFLNSLFETLGWDMLNRAGYAEAYKDVIHEDAIKVGGFTKAPDYCFRIGGTRKFFVEAKKPSVNVKDDISPAFQLRRYAWSAKLPLSILSDFEEFAVYDCRIKPVKTDKASTARIIYLTYEQYPDKWDEIASIFARDSILKGSFDRYVETTKGKKGTAEVDAAFLKEIESWRDSLARNLALRNPGLSQRELNYAVQNLIDRIIFLRMCEDRGIEEYGRLMALQNGSNVYGRLFELFQRADERYNSGLFHFRDEKGRSEAADQLTPTLKVEDKTLKDVIKNLYYPDSPYEFAVLPADILGQVYEQFLGKVIRLTAGHHAVVEDKPEVKKAGGVYYTPTYIVDYIVENTVGKLLEGKTPKQAAKLRILDPACGSGSFLIGAYQRLMDWHRDWYVDDGTEKHTKEVYQGPGGEWRLTTAERKRILLNNIFGVDIDPQAVEVTKLSLLLKVLEGESDETLAKQLQLFHERALPDLSENIKCGNSLIGPDFYENQQLLLMDDDEQYRINAFDWACEFSGVLKAGGFDAVIGNPPYVRQENISKYKGYFSSKYQTFSGAADLYIYFVEKALMLTKDGGLFSFIVSNKFVRSGYGKGLRRLLPSQGKLLTYVDFRDLPVFQGPTVYPCIVVVKKEKDRASAESNDVRIVEVQTLYFNSLSAYVEDHYFALPQVKLEEDKWLLCPVASSNIIEKISLKGIPLSEYCACEPRFGVKTGLNEVFVASKKRVDEITCGDVSEQDIFFPYLRGRNVGRYYHEEPHEYLMFTDNLDEESHPNVMAFLRDNKAKLEARTDIRNTPKKWYELRPCSYYDLFREPKIIYSSVANRGSFVLDGEGLFVDKTCYFIPVADEYLLGLLNSRLLFFIFSSIAVQRRGGYFEYLTEYVSRLPVVSDANADDKDAIIDLVRLMLALNRQLLLVKIPEQRESIKRKIETADRQIDKLIYNLYGLTDEEISIIENSIP